ncbi:MAG: TonB-dependent siderophore receptor, partial [Rhodocyclaceae bacterium]|nr:TonB-dependent siderophore receptor [Rhodocyclaceae bacterium]
MLRRTALCPALVLAGIIQAPTVLAQAELPAISIPAQPLGAALDALAVQARFKLLYSPDAVKGKTAPALAGRLSPDEALRRLLAGSGLTYSGADGAYAIKEATVEKLTKLSDIVVKGLRAETDGTGSYTSPALTVAGKVPLPMKEIPNSVSVLTRQQMDDQNMVSVWDAMTQIAGVQPIWNDNLQGQYHARGNALDIRYDGVPSLFPFSGNRQFDLAIYDRIEVQRGSAGLLQGSGSFAGTVNMVKKRPRDSFGAYVLGTVGSWNNKKIEADVTGPLNEDKSVRGRFVASAIDKDWFVNRVYDKSWLAYGVLEVDLSPATTVRVSTTGQRDETPSFSGLPTYTNGTLLNVDRSFNHLPTWNKTLWRSADLSAEIEHRFDNRWVGKVSVIQRDAFQHFKDAYLTTGVNPLTNTATYTRREFDYHYRSEDLDAYVSGPFELLGRTHNLLLGANYSWYRSAGKGVNRNQTGMAAVLDVTNVVFNDPPNVPEINVGFRTGSENITWQQGLYGQVRLSLADPLTLVLGGRSTDYYAKSHNVAPAAQTGWTPGTTIRHHITPYAGTVYDLTKQVSLYASYSDVFVPQSNLQSDGTPLKPREGRQYEIGAKGEFFDGKLTPSFAVFNIRDENRSYADPNYPGFYLPLGKVESKGWETEIAGSPARGWDISTSYTNLITRQLSTSTAASMGA